MLLYRAYYAFIPVVKKVVEDDIRSVLGYVPKTVGDVFKGVRDVLKRLSIANVRLDGDVLTMIVPSSESIEEGPKREIVLKDLEGRMRTVEVGVSLEESYYRVVVAPNQMKCTCPDANYRLPRASRILRSIGRERGSTTLQKLADDVYKYVFCKHTVAGLVLYATSVGLSTSVRKTATISALIRVVAEEENIPKVVEVLERIYGDLISST